MLRRGRLPLLMGILNVTPDSFSDGGQFAMRDQAVARADELIADGADLLDIGGESTRPGATPVPVAEELQRTIPVIRAVAERSRVPISIDTMKAAVAEQAVDAGAAIINDVTALSFDPEMLRVWQRTDAGLCLMHLRGTPQTMQEDPVYDDVVNDVIGYLRSRLEVCAESGVAMERLCVDPGIGFGKTAAHNLALLADTAAIRRRLGRPILIGHSRKRFLSRVLGRSVEERLAGTIGVSIALAERGADILRVHDVRAVRDALLAWDSLSQPLAGDQSPGE